jgi:Ca2+-binding RTX toxin-like protein
VPHVSVVAQGGSTVDFYRLDLANPMALMILDIDATVGAGTVVTVFDSAGMPLAENDDSDTFDPGSSSIFDSFLVFAAPRPGAYYIAVSNFPGGDPILFGEAYTLHVSVVNELSQGSGADTLDGGAGADTLVGGPGDDTYLADNPLDTIIEAAGGGLGHVMASVSWTLGDNLENLTLTGQAAISGFGNALANTITGNAAANLLDGLGGADVLVGGMGDVTYEVDVAGDTIIEAADAGLDTVIVSLSWALGDNLENLTLTGSGDFTATGNALANVLTGNSGNNTRDGLAGGDTLVGGLGDDTYFVDSGFDVIIEDANAFLDSVFASLRWTLGANIENLTLTGSGNFFGNGNNLDNVITGNSGANILDGKGGNDTLIGGAGFDTLIGGAGDDTMIGGTGNDKYVVESAGDSVVELAGDGTDMVRASVSFTLPDHVEYLTITGPAAIDGTGNGLVNIMVGNSAANTLTGLGGNDNLAGLGGNDILVGGAGRDRLNGGAGQDAFVFDTTPVNVTNTDIVADFTPGEDQIWLDAAIYAALGGPGGLAASALHIVTTGFAAADAADRIIYNSTNGALWYDADGNGAGAAVYFAQLSAGLALTAADFIVI